VNLLHDYLMERSGLEGGPMKNELPVPCSLMPAKLHERRRTTLARVRAAVLQERELDNGFSYRFPTDPGWISELANLIELEHRLPLSEISRYGRTKRRPDMVGNDWP
jgi:hypothetical protein